MMRNGLVIALVLGGLLPGAAVAQQGAPWARRQIDGSSRGADGVRFLDSASRDWLVTPWEEGGRVRLYQRPPSDENISQPWPAVTVGEVAAPEDAVLVDLDGDGQPDVVSCCEGRQRQLFIHWSPSAEKRMNPAAWQTMPLPATAGSSWMFCLPLQIDGQHGPDLVIGSKNNNAQLAWLQAPANPRQNADWVSLPLRSMGWTMSIAGHDFDGDADIDLLITDRKGPRRGCFWLENPGVRAVGRRVGWQEHPIGEQEVGEPMFCTRADLNADGRPDVIYADRQRGLIACFQPEESQGVWHEHRWALPPTVGTAKAVAVGRLTNHEELSVVVSCENARDERHGVFAVPAHKLLSAKRGELHRQDLLTISGPTGVKFDLVELVDLDADGDLDVLTCEETANLGVIWYENPLTSTSSTDKE